MEFGLDAEQGMLADSVRRWAANAIDEERLKALVDAGERTDPGLIEGLAGLGTQGILIPEELGGAGLGLLEAALVQEILGRHAAPVPWTASAVIAPMALAADPELAEAWLPRIAAGEARLGAGLASLTGTPDDFSLHLDGDRLSGSVPFVLDAEGADGHLVSVDRDTLILVEAGAQDLTQTELANIDRSRGLVELGFDRTPVRVVKLATDTLPRTLAAGRVALAADSLGAGQRMLERAVDYSLERRQFGRVIGSFQSVKHLCAEMAAELEPARSLVWYAAYAAGAFPEEFELMACHAKAHLGETGQFVARTSTEVHGGMGFTHDMGLHYLFKRIGLNRQLLGNPDRARRDAAVLQGWAA
jgi:alkylation response protein AidB-like acyl-CoA dehydrogenase